MFLGILLFFVVIALAIVAGRPGEGPADVPVSQTLTAPARTGWEPAPDRIGVWVVALLGLIAIAYGPFFATYKPNFVSPPFHGF